MYKINHHPRIVIPTNTTAQSQFGLVQAEKSSLSPSTLSSEKSQKTRNHGNHYSYDAKSLKRRRNSRVISKDSDKRRIIMNSDVPQTTWQPMMSSTNANEHLYVPSQQTYEDHKYRMPQKLLKINSTSKRKLATPEGTHNASKNVRSDSSKFLLKVNIPVVHTDSTSICDDEYGHYIVRPDDYLTPRYRILKLLGQGTFGKVVQCWDSQLNEFCAIKIIRSTQKYRDASVMELRVLKTIEHFDPDNLKKCIHAKDCFDFKRHICIVMDLLSVSVFDFLKKNNYIPFPLEHIRSFARQLITSVAFLHDLNLVHTDLKPENIMLIENRASSQLLSSARHNGQCETKILYNTAIRLIDFGNASIGTVLHKHLVSTRHYRAPEIILGMNWSFPCDMWSIGCILTELFTGQALFQTHDNLEHLAMMEVFCGRIPENMVRRASAQATMYFKSDGSVQHPGPKTSKTSLNFVRSMKSLESMFPPYSQFNIDLCDLLRKLFVYEPEKRMTAREALQHPFITR